MKKNYLKGKTLFKGSRNKRGEDLIVDFWAILVFVIILLIFLIIAVIDKNISSKGRELQELFISNDLDYMLNSYLKAPYIYDNTKTNGEILVEDFMNDDFSRTDNAFNLFFLGINTTNNNPVGKYTLIVTESDFIRHSISVDPISKGYALDKLYRGKLIVEKYAVTPLPKKDNGKISVTLKIEYVMMYDKPFE